MSAFLKALAAKTSAIQDQRSAIETIEVKDVEPIEVEATVTINESRNRIDVTFNSIPGDEMRSHLKRAGFRFHGGDCLWYHFDSEENRAALREILDCEIDRKIEQPAAIVTAAPILEVAPASIEGPDRESLSAINAPLGTPFEVYKRQVDDIVSYTGASPADLQLLAWRCLYAVIFGGGVTQPELIADLERIKKAYN
jgi:hypothetical protein